MKLVRFFFISFFISMQQSMHAIQIVNTFAESKLGTLLRDNCILIEVVGGMFAIKNAYVFHKVMTDMEKIIEFSDARALYLKAHSYRMQALVLAAFHLRKPIYVTFKILFLRFFETPEKYQKELNRRLFGAIKSSFVFSSLWIDILIALGADVNARNDEGCSPLLEAIFAKKLNRIKKMLSVGADVNGINPYRTTAIIEAVLSVQVGAVRELLKAGADITTRDAVGKTAEEWAENRVNEGRLMRRDSEKRRKEQIILFLINRHKMSMLLAPILTCKVQEYRKNKEALDTFTQLFAHYLKKTGREMQDNVTQDIAYHIVPYHYSAPSHV